MKNKIYHVIGRFFQKVSRWFFDRVLMACWHCGALVGMNSTFAKGHMWCEPCFQRYVAPERNAAQQSVHPTMRCAGHEGGSLVKDCVCQTCGLYSPA